MPKLGVNIDHIATLRQARREFEPNPIYAAEICERAGADSIVAHLREDRRHIQDADIKALRKIVKTRLNLECCIDPKIIKIIARIRPDQATLVPERRQEITTEGGLDVNKNFLRIKTAVKFLQSHGIEVSLFIDPIESQILKTVETHAHIIELHTGSYSQAKSKTQIQAQLGKLVTATRFAQDKGLIVNVGHGLNYENTSAVAAIKGIEELNIGHSIISRAVFVGLEQAVKEMIKLVKN